MNYTLSKESNDRIEKLKNDHSPKNVSLDAYLSTDYLILPGFADVHVHLREPGFSYKETIKSGTQSAAAGGFTDVCAMPNVTPAPDSEETLKILCDIINTDSLIRVHPYATITEQRLGISLSKLICEENANSAVCAYSDDGSGIQSEPLMKSAMENAYKQNMIIAAHCEDLSLVNGGYIHDGEYAHIHNHKGISSESEYSQIARDIDLAEQTGCKYHVCHISTKESVELIRKAKKRGVDISCETAPHYLLLCENDLKEQGNFKMNPPLRSEEDRLALIEGIKDGTIDMIATDHAPHTAEEKSKGLSGSAMGVVGLETSFAVMYTYFVKTGIISLDRLIELMAIAPRERFGIKMSDDYSIWKINEEYTIDPSKFKSMGHATPFEGMSVSAKCIKTILNGKTVYELD